MKKSNNDKLTPDVRFRGYTDDWKQEKLGNLARFINGRAYSQNELLSIGKYKVLRVGNFYTNDTWYYSNLELNDKYYANNGDLLYTWSATLGPHIWNGGKVIYHYHIWKLELTPEFNKIFAVQLLIRDKNVLESGTNGSTMAHITKKGMEEKIVSVPSNINEQEIIGIFLTKLDNLITLLQHKQKQLEQLKKAMLQKMFPKKESQVPEIRFDGFRDVWKQKKLGEVGRTQSGIGFPTKEQGGQTGIPFFKVSDMNGNGNEFEMKISNNYVTEHQIVQRKWKPINDVPAVIFAKVGAALMLNRKRIVKVPFLIDNNTMSYIFGNEWNPYFGKTLFDIINLPKYAQIGALPSFNGSDIENIKVNIPSKDEQQRISQLLNNINCIITLNQKKLDYVTKIKKYLLQKMFI